MSQICCLNLGLPFSDTIIYNYSVSFALSPGTCDNYITQLNICSLLCIEFLSCQCMIHVCLRLSLMFSLSVFYIILFVFPCVFCCMFCVSAVIGFMSVVGLAA